MKEQYVAAALCGETERLVSAQRCEFEIGRGVAGLECPVVCHGAHTGEEVTPSWEV